MECKACGVWFVSGDKSGVCHTCKRTLKNMGLDLPYERLRELVEADRDGRCVVLPCKVGDELFYSDGEWIGKETVEKIVIDIETDGGIYAPRDIGYSVYKSAEEAEATLKEDQYGQDL